MSPKVVNTLAMSYSRRTFARIVKHIFRHLILRVGQFGCVALTFGVGDRLNENTIAGVLNSVRHQYITSIVQCHFMFLRKRRELSEWNVFKHMFAVLECVFHCLLE